jgi:hypothetical protein
MKVVYTSISIDYVRKSKFKECAGKLGVSNPMLLSVLAFKAGIHIAKVVRCLKSVEYQDRSGGYKPMPVNFFDADHEYLHSCRLSSKISVSKLIALAIDLFIDELMKNGINPLEIAMLRKKKNSYTKKSYYCRNFSFSTDKNDQFQEYIMKIRFNKT